MFLSPIENIMGVCYTWELLINKLWVTTIFPSDWVRIVNNAIADGRTYEEKP